jgi:hypothetical protein
MAFSPDRDDYYCIIAPEKGDPVIAHDGRILKANLVGDKVLHEDSFKRPGWRVSPGRGTICSVDDESLCMAVRSHYNHDTYKTESHVVLVNVEELREDERFEVPQAGKGKIYYNGMTCRGGACPLSADPANSLPQLYVAGSGTTFVISNVVPAHD